MMLVRVPTLSSEWSGIGTVVVVLSLRFCMTIWLPRCRTAEKPWASSNRHTSRPDKTRSSPNRDLDARDEHLAVQPPLDFGLVG